MIKSYSELLEDYYSKYRWFSPSALGRLLWSPSAYAQKYIYGDDTDKKSPEQVKGSLVHKLILEPHLVDDCYVVSPNKIPDGNPKLIIDKVFKVFQAEKALMSSNQMNYSNVPLLEYSALILETMVELSYHQSLVDDKPKKGETEFKTGDQKRLEKVLTPDNVAYFEFLCSLSGKETIEQSDYDYCKRAADAVRNHPKISDILGLNDTFNPYVETFYEKELKIELPDYPFGLKGILDGLKIDHEKKMIYVSDIKTSGKELSQFKKSLFEFGYNRQSAAYFRLVMTIYADLIADGYELDFYFIVIDKGMNVYPFRVSFATMEQWLVYLEADLVKAQYHYESKDFSLPHDFARELVEL